MPPVIAEPVPGSIKKQPPINNWVTCGACGYKNHINDLAKSRDVCKGGHPFEPLGGKPKAKVH